MAFLLCTQVGIYVVELFWGTVKAYPMILHNLFRRLGRTIFGILGFCIGMICLIDLGAVIEELNSGYRDMVSGSQADLVLSNSLGYDIIRSTLDQELIDQIAILPEVAAVTGLLHSYFQIEGQPWFSVFGYPENSYVLDRFQIIEKINDESLEVDPLGRKRLLLGTMAAERLNKSPGDTLTLKGNVYRIVSIYRTGNVVEDSGAVLYLSEAQNLFGKPRKVNLVYIQLRDLKRRDQLIGRIKQRWPELSLSSTDDYMGKQKIEDVFQGYVIIIGGLAIIISCVCVMCSQMMSVFERSHEIGVLRAIGWSQGKVMLTILNETLCICLIGGLLGVVIGWLNLSAFPQLAGIIGLATARIHPEMLARYFGLILLVGICSGLYPAYRAARMSPVDALRHEGGSSCKNARRIPLGGMAIQSLWQRTGRSVLSIAIIAFSVGGNAALNSLIGGGTSDLTNIALGAHADVMIREKNAIDTSLSTLGNHIGVKISSSPEVEGVSGLLFIPTVLPETGDLFLLQGYGPNEFAIQRFQVVDGARLCCNHQMMLGRLAAEVLNKHPGDTIELGGERFKVVGIFESGIAWEEMGGVITERNAQTFAGMPGKVTVYAVKMQDPAYASDFVERINSQFPEVLAALTSEFVDQMPDITRLKGVLNTASLLTMLIGCTGVMNIMFMNVWERRREIGILRAVGWCQRSILGLFLREALLLGIIGGVIGIGLSFGITYAMRLHPFVRQGVRPLWGWEEFASAVLMALLIAVIGGCYPAYYATRLDPVETLRHE